MMCSGPQLTGLHVSMTDAPSLSVRHKRLIGILLLILVLGGIWYLLSRTPPSAPAFQRGAWNQATPVHVVPAARQSRCADQGHRDSHSAALCGSAQQGRW